MGPALVPARFIPDPQALTLRTWVSGALKQDSNTAQMIFTTAEQIAFVSRLTGVVPGDLFATGTPAGVGMPRNDFLKPGDIVEIEVERIAAAQPGGGGTCGACPERSRTTCGERS
jgi:2-keto-4-pentenoate hydratase/2-oxohepta-3-ene-1,7-dioic acid hydratase in catechol pathway